MGQKASVNPVTVGPTVVQLLPLRPERELTVIYNVTGTLYIKYGAGASDSSFTDRLQANESRVIYKYTGPITAIKATGISTVMVTECW